MCSYRQPSKYGPKYGQKACVPAAEMHVPFRFQWSPFMSVLFRRATMTMAWAIARQQVSQSQFHVSSVRCRAHLLIQSPTFITAITAARVAEIAVVLAMAAHDDEREREQLLTLLSITIASTSTP